MGRKLAVRNNNLLTFRYQLADGSTTARYAPVVSTNRGAFGSGTILTIECDYFGNHVVLTNGNIYGMSSTNTNSKVGGTVLFYC
jgi:hypothetical protein